MNISAKPVAYLFQRHEVQRHKPGDELLSPRLVCRLAYAARDEVFFQTHECFKCLGASTRRGERLPRLAPPHDHGDRARKDEQGNGSGADAFNDRRGRRGWRLSGAGRGRSSRRRRYPFTAGRPGADARNEHEPNSSLRGQLERLRFEHLVIHRGPDTHGLANRETVELSTSLLVRDRCQHGTRAAGAELHSLIRNILGKGSTNDSYRHDTRREVANLQGEP